MKMTQQQYDQLKADVEVIATAYKLFKRPDTSMSVMWAIFHQINAHRSYGDDHPRWKTETRLLPASHVDGKTWAAELYESGLFDKHIETALKKIAQEWAK